MAKPHGACRRWAGISIVSSAERQTLWEGLSGSLCPGAKPFESGCGMRVDARGSEGRAPSCRDQVAPRRGAGRGWGCQGARGSRTAWLCRGGGGSRGRKENEGHAAPGRRRAGGARSGDRGGRGFCGGHVEGAIRFRCQGGSCTCESGLSGGVWDRRKQEPGRREAEPTESGDGRLEGSVFSVDLLGQATPEAGPPGTLVMGASQPLFPLLFLHRFESGCCCLRWKERGPHTGDIPSLSAWLSCLGGSGRRGR